MIRLFRLAVLIATSSFSQVKNPVVITVNGNSVYADELAYLFRKNYPERKDRTRAKVNEYLNLYIRFKLKVEEAINRGTDTTRQFLKEYNTYRNELRKTYLHEEKLTDSLLRLTYDHLKEEISAAHLLVAVSQDASPTDTARAWQRVNDLLKRIKNNEPFEELAEKFSDDPSARHNRGHLGYFTAMQMVYPFEAAAYSGKPGDVVGPVRTRFGYHLIKIEDRKPTRGEVEVSHIMLRNTTGRDENQTRNLIFEIYEQLKGGVPWAELCTKYSEDLNSKNNNCKLRPFGVGAFAQVPEFESVAFSLQNPGDISDPFKTAYGWHIIRLEKKIPLPSFEELKNSLRNRVVRDERMQIARDRYYAKLKKRFSFSENEKFKSVVFATADTSLTKGNWNPRALPVHETLLVLGDKKISVGDFVRFARLNQEATTLKPDEYMKQLYRKFTESVLDEQAENEVLKNKPEYRFLMKEYYEGILLFDIMEKEIWNRAAEDTAGLRKYFEANRSKYQAAGRVKAVIYSASTAEALKQLKVYLENKDSAAAAQWISDKRIRRDAGKFQRTDRAILQSVAWEPGLHEAENNGMYYLVHILQIIPPGLLSFDEARITAISDYQQELEERWLSDLQKKYPVIIHEKGRKQLIRMLRR
ncbi:MAG: peptidylprolyl isomerase [Cyclobacteriaceae bacterium]|nr:peptidylprolyl isomerase [Cyclobacteriaceae bacterium]